MPDERESPSAGWREVCDKMETDSGIETAIHSCPDCGQQCENVLRDVYECDEHGVFRASAPGGESADSPPGADAVEDVDDEIGERNESPERDGSGKSDSAEADGSEQSDDTEDRTTKSPGTA